MSYEYQESAGYYGTGAWVVYGRPDCYGYRIMINYFATAKEAERFIEEQSK